MIANSPDTLAYNDAVCNSLDVATEQEGAMTSTEEIVVTRTVSVPEAARAYGISRGQAYELARRDELPGVIKLGGRYVVSRAVMERVLNGEPA